MSTVYSRRFAFGTVSSSQVMATVPPGRVWVLRNITGMASPTGSPINAYVTVNGQAIGHLVTSTSAPVDFQWNGMLVLGAGDTIGYVPNAAGTSVTLAWSGYDFLA